MCKRINSRERIVCLKVLLSGNSANRTVLFIARFLVHPPHGCSDCTEWKPKSSVFTSAKMRPLPVLFQNRTEQPNVLCQVFALCKNGRGTGHKNLRTCVYHSRQILPAHISVNLNLEVVALRAYITNNLSQLLDSSWHDPLAGKSGLDSHHTEQVKVGKKMPVSFHRLGRFKSQSRPGTVLFDQLDDTQRIRNRIWMKRNNTFLEAKRTVCKI